MLKFNKLMRYSCLSFLEIKIYFLYLSIQSMPWEAWLDSD